MTTAAGERIGHDAIGLLGERVAAAWLRREGCRVLYRNYRAPGGGEVDLVVRDAAVLAFTEVKTRSAGGRGRPLEAVGPDKQRLIRRGANSWLKLLGTREIPWRYDVIEVIVEDGVRPRVNRVQDAFRRQDD